MATLLYVRIPRYCVRLGLPLERLSESFNRNQDWLITSPDSLQESYDPSQPRIPAGSGKESGRWAKRGGSGQVKILQAHYREIPDRYLVAKVGCVAGEGPANQTEQRGRNPELDPGG